MNKCRHKNSILFETHKLTELQPETQQMTSSGFFFFETHKLR